MLYTGKGDTGTTQLYVASERIPKDTPRIDALGNLDELNSWLGYCAAVAYVQERKLKRIVRTVQEDLFVIQAMLAGAPKTLGRERVGYLESIIAKVEKEIAPIRSFTIPGATMLSGALDVGRTIARRAERSVIALHDETLVENAIPYLNRLSSLLFALARLSAHRAGVKEPHPSY